MICTTDFTTSGDTLRVPNEDLEQLTEQWLEGLPEVIRVVVNKAMHIEREDYLQTRPYERNEFRRGHANGYKPKTVKIRVGEATFEVPRVREGGLYHCAGGGSCSRYEWAKAILDLDPHKEEQIVKRFLPAKSGDFPTLAYRPMESILLSNLIHSRLSMLSAHWFTSLEFILDKKVNKTNTLLLSSFNGN